MYVFQIENDLFNHPLSATAPGGVAGPQSPRPSTTSAGGGSIGEGSSVGGIEFTFSTTDKEVNNENRRGYATYSKNIHLFCRRFFLSLVSLASIFVAPEGSE